jgi:hypothetical protein
MAQNKSLSLKPFFIAGCCITKHTTMKNKIIIPISIFVVSLCTIACNGDHSDRTVRDTTGTAETHVDPSMKNPPSNIDTTKTTTTTGGASSVDNSGSGGTKIDSVKKTKPNK